MRCGLRFLQSRSVAPAAAAAAVPPSTPTAHQRAAPFSRPAQSRSLAATPPAATQRRRQRSMADSAAVWASAAGAAQVAAAAAAQADGAAAAGGKQLPLVLVVAVVLLDGQGRVLLAQRPPGKKLAGLWEFPGGKIDAGESPEAALVRELAEELGIQVAPPALSPLTFASHAYETFHLLMPTYACALWDGEPTGREGQALAWVTAEQLAKGEYAMPPADEPLLPAVLAAMRAHRAAATERAASLGAPGGWDI